LVDGILLILSYVHRKTRNFVSVILPFWLTGFTYEYFQFVERFKGEIHVADLYQAELTWFGVNIGSERIIACEYFRRNPHVIFDLVSGFAYLFYIYEVFLLAMYLFFKNKAVSSLFCWGFFSINVVGMVGYFLYPAAPPWYVEAYGLGPAQLDALPSAAGSARFDELLGITYFKEFYSRSANVFGAMPSLHAAYPLFAVLFAWFIGRRKVFFILTLAFALLVDFAAIYLRHHYILDVLVGTIIAVGIFFASYYYRKDTFHQLHLSTSKSRSS
jgi:membrane-associated phospholipid phosphatase